MSLQEDVPAESSTARTRTRLTTEGSAFLLDYARTVGSYPSRAEKIAILARLRAMPGNETFTLGKLNGWFSRHRKPSHDARPTVLLDDETILFPKLTLTHIQQLRVLYRKRIDPPEGIITFWASRIGAERSEVAAWIQYQQEKAKEAALGATPESPDTLSRKFLGDSASDNASVSPTVCESPRAHLPTPAESLSPTISPQRRVPSLPPVAVKMEDVRQCLSPVSLMSTTPLKPRPTAQHIQPNEFVPEGLPTWSTLHETSTQEAKPPPVAISVPNFLRHTLENPSQRDRNRMLAAVIRNSLQPNAIPSDQLPRTVDEFAEKFQTVESMIDVFMKKYDSGRLVPLGWDASLSKVII